MTEAEFTERAERIAAEFNTLLDNCPDSWDGVEKATAEAIVSISKLKDLCQEAKKAGLPFTVFVIKP